MLATLLLLGLLSLAASTDLLRHKIHNWTTYPGILAAVLFNGTSAALLEWTQVERASLERLVGYIGVWESLIGLAACGLPMLLCYVMLKLGGGDVKMMAMVGAFLGPQGGLEAMLWTFVLGMCLAVIVLIWRVGPVALASRVFRQVMYTLRLGRFDPLSADQRQQLQSRLFLAPCALVAAVIVRFGLSGMV
jgi:prepilin peptidase CpaA